MSDDRILAALRPVVAVFEGLGILYQIGGSVASSTFGHARTTLDVDLVADVRSEHAEPIAAALRDRFYAEPELIREAVRHRSCFNLIYLPAYFKVDVFVPKDTAYERTAFARGRVCAVRGTLLRSAQQRGIRSRSHDHRERQAALSCTSEQG